jgi:hypothetical protein
MNVKWRNKQIVFEKYRRIGTQFIEDVIFGALKILRDT